MGGQAVSGNLVFVGADKKESLPVLIGADGTYIVDLSPGEYTILVKSMGGGLAGPAPVMPEGVKGPELTAGGGPGGTAPPAKYGSIETSDLKFKKSAGKETHDIELKAS